MLYFENVFLPGFYVDKVFSNQCEVIEVTFFAVQYLYVYLFLCISWIRLKSKEISLKKTHKFSRWTDYAA